MIRLAREPGRRESRYAHLFCGNVEEDSESNEPDRMERGQEADQAARIEQLEAVLNEMRREIENLRARVDELESHRN
ncbi:MAG: hypothetical protein JAZ02_17435 [Candidatus Thiodiazotropha endolucinida]|nr:hypothetical protein [Candidatus Thiodiazotropha endolucinida]